MGRMPLPTASKYATLVMLHCQPQRLGAVAPGPMSSISSPSKLSRRPLFMSRSPKCSRTVPGSADLKSQKRKAPGPVGGGTGRAYQPAMG